MTKLNLDPNVFSDLGALVADSKAVAEANNAANQEISARKIAMYARLAGEIWSVGLKKGNLPKYAREEFQEAMMNGASLDASKGAGQRYFNGAVGISRMRKELEIPAQATVDAIKSALDANGINTEAKLHTLISGGPASDIAKVVARYVGRATYGKDDDGKKFVTGYKAGARRDELDDLIEALQMERSLADEVLSETCDAVTRVEKVKAFLAETE